MGSVYFLNQFAVSAVIHENIGGDVWTSKPTDTAIVLYTVVVPAIAAVGIVGNVLSVLIFRHKELKASVYTYLAVLAAIDVCASIFIVVFGLSNGLLYDSEWGIYDTIIGFPLSGLISCASVLTTVAITVDRVIYLWDPFRVCKPKFCNPDVARRIVIFNLCTSVIVNLPYCFIFYVSTDGNEVATTPFFKSTYYMVHNWMRLVFFAIIPLIILIFGNGFLIAAYRKALKYTSACHVNKTKVKNNLASLKFTVILILMVIFFILSSIPVQLLSRNTVVSILFDGDEDRIDSESLDVAREIFAVTTAIAVSVNVFIYYALCPSFARVWKKVFPGKKNRKQSVQVNVYLINRVDNGNRANCGAPKNIMKIVAKAAVTNSDEVPCINYECVVQGQSDDKVCPTDSEYPS